MTLKPYEWKDGLLHLNFVVNDLEKAWLCAKDVETFISQMSPGATVTHSGGTAGQEGVTYTTTQTIVSGGEHVRTTVVTTSYTVTEINEYDKIIKYNALGTHGMSTPQPFELIVHVGATSPAGARIVKITSSQKQQKIPTCMLIAMGIPCFCMPFLVMALMKSTMATAMKNLVIRLQHHFNTFTPRVGESHNVSAAIGDVNLGSVVPTASTMPSTYGI